MKSIGELDALIGEKVRLHWSDCCTTGEIVGCFESYESEDYGDMFEVVGAVIAGAKLTGLSGVEIEASE